MLVTVTWDPGQYLRFADYRERPFDELVARVGVDSPRLVVDLGCGPGTTTARIGDRWPSARIVGVDSSPEMIERATSLARPGQLSFEPGDVRSWQPQEPVSVIVCNAVLQWVPEHVELLPRFIEWLEPGGVLAFQVPANFDVPIHTELRRLATSGRWSIPTDGLLRDAPVLMPAGYLDRLQAAGADADVWETTYLQVLRGQDAVLEWARGTALRPVLSVLDAEEAASFEEAYRTALRVAYPLDPAGRSVLPYRRIFAVATKAADGAGR
jgi:trans-aconitate 2-methyltransferase